MIEIDIINEYIEKYNLSYTTYVPKPGCGLLSEFITNFSYIDILGREPSDPLFLRFELRKSTIQRYDVKRHRYIFEWQHDHKRYYSIIRKCSNYVGIEEYRIVREFMDAIIDRNEFFAIKYDLI